MGELSRYETELSELHAEASALITEAHSLAEDPERMTERQTLLERASEKLKEERDAFEMCEMEATSVKSQERLQQYRQNAQELRERLLAEQTGASREELFGDEKPVVGGAGMAKLDETERIGSETLAELHKQGETMKNIDNK